MNASDICVLNYRLLMRVIAAAAPGVGALGVEPKELFVLAEIEAHPFPAELAEIMSMPKATITLYLKQLQRAGFVSREIDPTDLRRHRLALTSAGRKAVRQGMKLIAAAFETHLKHLSETEQQALTRLLSRVLA